MSLIKLIQVHKIYDLGETRIPALQGIDLQIESGEFVAIGGPSGSGKSTLCNLIGLLDHATRGNVVVANQDVSSLSDARLSTLRSETIGFIFQHFNLIPVLNALENVMLPLQIRGERTHLAKQQAMLYLSELGLAAHVTHRPHKLSGGQQQRVAIARALVTQPRLIVADEPTANLDSVTALKIIDLMRHLNRQRGTTFIFSTHDQHLLERVDRCIVLQDGTIVEDVIMTAKEGLLQTGGGQHDVDLD